ncbi:hypothetical protein ABID22_003925 [Pontibacter aydingkolensis]
MSYIINLISGSSFISVCCYAGVQLIEMKGANNIY